MLKKLSVVLLLLFTSTLVIAKDKTALSFQELVTKSTGGWWFEHTSVKMSNGSYLPVTTTWIFKKTGKTSGKLECYRNSLKFPKVDDIETGMMKGNLFEFEADYVIEGDKLTITYTKLIEGYQKFDYTYYVGGTAKYHLAYEDEELLLQGKNKTFTLCRK